MAKGEFDRLLVRPLPPLFQLLAERFQTDGIGELAAGVAVITWAGSRLGLHTDAMTLVLGGIAVLGGVAIYASIKLILASFAFWIKFSQSYLFAAYKMADFAMYPMGIYPAALRFILTFALPFAFTAYYPAAALLGRESMLTGIGGTVLAGAIVAIISAFVWKAGLRAYESAGS